jgi:hypothetical protein
MAYTQADLDALDVEIATIRTVKSTTTADQSTTFRDLDELLRLRAVMAQSMAARRNASHAFRRHPEGRIARWPNAAGSIARSALWRLACT